MAFLVYLYDGQREMAEHPFNGAEWSASGRMAKNEIGDFIKGTISGVVAYSPKTCEAIRSGEILGEADYMLGEEFGFRKGCARLTAADFPGKTNIRVKVWCSGETIEFRRLAPDA